MRVLTQPISSTPTSTATIPTVTNVSTQVPVTRSTTESILTMVYNLATGKFRKAPPTITQNEGSNPPPLKDIPSAPVIQGASWPNAGSVSENVFETRKDWPIPPTPVPTCAPIIKTDEPPQVTAIPCAMVMPK